MLHFKTYSVNRLRMLLRTDLKFFINTLSGIFIVYNHKYLGRRIKKMVKKFLSFACCFAICTPIVTTAMVQDNQVAIVADATSNYNMKASSKAVNLIKSCEGFSSKAYWDYKQWTIGYGTYVESDTTYPNGITEAEAEQLLYNALEYFENCLNGFLKRNSITVNQNQFDALLCFTYAIPAWTYKGNEDYTIAQMMINGWENYSDQEIYDIFGLYVKAGTGENKVTLPGLVKRRVMEASLFLYGNTTTTAPQDTNSSVNDNTSSSTTEVTTWVVSEKVGIRLCDSYGMSGKKIALIPDKTTITVYETIKADGYTWGKVDYNGLTGWCALDYCTQVTNAKVKGDINGDGKLSMSDLCMLKNYVNGLLSLTDEQLQVADINGNGEVTTADYQQLLKTYALT